MADELRPEEEAEFQEFLAWRASQQAKAPSWSPLESAKHLASGAIEGTAGFAGMVGDVLKAAVMGPPREWFQKPPAKFNELPPTKTLSSALAAGTGAVLPEADPQYRYARTIGQSVGPGAALNKITKAPMMAGVLWDTLSGIGAQAGGDLTEDHPLGRLAGGVVPAVARSGLQSTGNIYNRYFTSAPEREKATAAYAFNELTGLDETAVREALKKRPNDELGRLMTTAELTDNPAASSIMQEAPLSGISAVKARDDALNEARRKTAWRGLDESLATPSELGSQLIKSATGQRDRLKEAADLAYKKVSRRAPIYIEDIRAELKELTDQQMGGSPPGPAFQRIAQQIAEPMEGVAAGKTKAGRLMDIRTELIQTPDEVLTPIEQRVRGMLISKITDRLDLELKNSAAWKTGRSLTARRQSTFERGTPGGSLVNPATQPINAFGASWKGTKEGARKLRDAIGNNPELLKKYKAQLIDSLPINIDDEFTIDKTRKWLKANEDGARELLGEKHVRAIRRVLESLESQRRGKRLANWTSSGLSPTASRTTAADAIADTVAGSLVPGGAVVRSALGAVRGKINDEIKKNVQNWMIKASLDPEVAIELLKTPTKARLESLSFRMAEDLAILANNTTRAGLLTASSLPEEKKKGQKE